MNVMFGLTSLLGLDLYMTGECSLIYQRPYTVAPLFFQKQFLNILSGLIMMKVIILGLLFVIGTCSAKKRYEMVQGPWAHVWT